MKTNYIEAKIDNTLNNNKSSYKMIEIKYLITKLTNDENLQKKWMQDEVC